MVRKAGNLYSGSTPTVIARILDEAEPGDKILATSYGSGASAKSLYIEVKEGIKDKRQEVPVKEQLDNMKEIGWERYEELKRLNEASNPDWKTGTIKPLEGSEVREISICENCGRIYFPSLGSYFVKECLDPNCEDDQIRKEDLPREGRLVEIVEKPPYERSPKGVVVPIIGEATGEDLEGVPRRIKTEGKEGILEYGWAYK